MYNVISLFSGCGGIDFGFSHGFSYGGTEFKRPPYRILWANDIDRFATEVYNHNFGTKFEPCDIRDVSFEKVNIGGEEVDVLIAGFPCQEFSLSGPRNGLRSTRGSLYLEIRRALTAFSPKLFMAENVPGIEYPPRILKTIITALSNSEGPQYDVSVYRINVADFGVPQIRQRVILIGTRSDFCYPFAPPQPTNRGPSIENDDFELPSWIRSVAAKGPATSDELVPWMTAKDAIQDIWNPFGTDGSGIPDQEKLTHATIVLNRQGRRDRRLRADLPSPTIRAQHHGHVEVHYGDQSDGSLRRLTIRECARIQGFPDGFEFPVTATQAYLQIGNAMPPVAVYHWAAAIASWLRKGKSS